MVASWLLALALLGNSTSGTSRVSGPLPGVLLGLRRGERGCGEGLQLDRNRPVGGEERRDKLDGGAGESQAPWSQCSPFSYEVWAGISVTCHCKRPEYHTEEQELEGQELDGDGMGQRAQGIV